MSKLLVCQYTSANTKGFRSSFTRVNKLACCIRNEKKQTESQKLTIEVDRANVLEEHPSFHRVHLLADTRGARTQVQVHAV